MPPNQSSIFSLSPLLLFLSFVSPSFTSISFQDISQLSHSFVNFLKHLISTGPPYHGSFQLAQVLARSSASIAGGVAVSGVGVMGFHPLTLTCAPWTLTCAPRMLTCAQPPPPLEKWRWNRMKEEEEMGRTRHLNKNEFSEDLIGKDDNIFVPKNDHHRDSSIKVAALKTSLSEPTNGTSQM